MSLELIDLSLTAPGASAPLFVPLSLVVAPGETVCLMGPSGIGKSSLLAHIGGHLPRGFTASGDVRLDGESVTHLPAEKRGIGMLFQQAQLFPHLSVGDNLAFGLSVQVKGKVARRAAVEAALEQAGLAGMADRDPATLSGGQRTRAALMRTLLARPRAVLIDEPFAALDAELRAEIRSFTLQHLEAERIPCLMVSHDPEDGAAAARRIALG